MTNFEGIDNLRFAKSEALLANGYVKQSYGFPEPETVSYTTGSQVIALTGGGTAIRGFKTVILLWLNVGAEDAYYIKSLVSNALGDTGEMWATVDESWNGDGPPGSWVDVSGTPRLPQFSPGDGSHGLVIPEVTLQIDNVTVQNDPASF